MEKEFIDDLVKLDEEFKKLGCYYQYSDKLRVEYLDSQTSYSASHLLSLFHDKWNHLPYYKAVTSVFLVKHYLEDSDDFWEASRECV